MAGGGDGINQGPGSNGFRLVAQKVYNFPVERQRWVRLGWFDGWKNRHYLSRSVGWIDEDHRVPTRAAETYREIAPRHRVCGPVKSPDEDHIKV
jgi:hypothetical protein